LTTWKNLRKINQGWRLNQLGELINMTLETLLTHPAVQALGRSLLHFLWQGSLLALLLWMIKTIVPASARIRYAAASLIMLMMPVALVVTISGDFRNQPEAATLAPIAPLAAATAPISFAAPVEQTTRVGIWGWVVCLWLAGVVLLSLRATGGWMRAQRLKRRVLPASGELQDMMTRLKQRLRVSAPVRFYTSAIVEVPTVIGWIRPYLLLPVTTLTGLSESQLEAILAHELAHIRRHDYLVNLLQTAIETVLFYHPAVWWVGKQMRVEREHCCDDIAVAVCGNAIEYAGALAELEQIRGRIPEPALAATGGELLGRIRRLLGQQPSEDRASRSLGTIIAAGLVLFIAMVPAVRSQSAAPQPPQITVTPPLAPVPPKDLSPKIPKTQVPAPPLLPDIRPAIDEDLHGVNLQVAELQAQLEAQAGQPAPRPDRGSQDPAKTASLLIKLFDEERDPQMKRAILAYLGESPDPRAQEKLRLIFRSDSDMQIRRAALAYVAEQAKSFDTLASLYDNETNIEMKRAMLAYIGDSDDPRATDKLMSIVQSGAAVELRRSALAYLAER
jgi:beta-lactamase regulating signal transducer with metallopeptidase domain